MRSKGRIINLRQTAISARLRHFCRSICKRQWAAEGRANDKKYGVAVLETVSQNGNDMNVSDTWFVCPACGSISDSIAAAGTKNCNQCGVAEQDYIVVQN